MDYSHTTKLAELIQHKHDCLNQLSHFSLQQIRAISENHYSDLVKILGYKQHVLNQLRIVEEKLQKYSDEDAHARVWESPTKRQECARTEATCRLLVDELVRQETLIEKKLNEWQGALARRLQTRQGQNHAANAYASQL